MWSIKPMKKVIVISDSFKGSLSSSAIVRVARDVLGQFYPNCQVIGLPVADGGEGTVDCFLEAVGGEQIAVPVTGPWGESVEACYGRIGDTAVVEMAAAAGLPMVGERLDPSKTTTYGVGQLLRHAVEHGATHLILGLGGSATNDGGCGAAAAMGVVFRDKAGQSFVPVGETLGEIASIDCTAARALLSGVTVEVMCDIDNPLCGPQGAAAIFGPQKGADAAMIRQLDHNLGYLARRIETDLGITVSELPGAGAAGGFGAGAAAFFGAQLRPGIEVVLDLVRFEEQLDGCDLVLTGEGRMDGQSLGGKVPIGVSRRAKKKQVPVVAIVGITGPGIEPIYDEGITAVFSTNREALPFAAVRDRGEDDYRRALTDLMRYTKAISG